MNTPLRILREAALEVGFTLFPLTPRQQAREARLIGFATDWFAEHGFAGVSMTRLARSAGVAPRTIAMHFCDLDALLFLILKSHIEALAAALAEIPETAADCLQRRIQAYLAHTRTPQGTLINPHLLLVRDRERLPVDLYLRVEPMRVALGRAVLRTRAQAALGVMDDIRFAPDTVELLVQSLRARPEPTSQEEPPLARARNDEWQTEAFKEWTSGQGPRQVN